jgi:hypothetical protein
MYTQPNLQVRLSLSAVAVLLGLATLMLFNSGARAEVLDGYEPQALIQAETALAEGEASRALALLRSQRSLLAHDKFRVQSQALACQAYFQQGQLARAERACDQAVKYAGPESMDYHLGNQRVVRLAKGTGDEAIAGALP